MTLSSARELKAALRDTLVTGLAAALRRQGALVTAAARARPAPSAARTVALGITRARGTDFRLAVRIQRRGLEDAPAVRAIRERARGEVDVRYVGRVAKQARRAAAADPGLPWHQGRTRPLLIGASIGHHRITAGTLGGFVVLRKGGAVRALSNNHVLADEDRGRKGDAILQPGAYDGGRAPADRVGALDRAVKLKPRGTNRVDAALATVEAKVGYDPRTLREVGTLSGLAATPAEEIERVLKLGRTTGHTRGRVTAFELDNVVVAYDTGGLRFDDQIEVEGADAVAFSQGGDSGSLVLASDDHGAFGLLFAGSDQGGTNGYGLTYVNVFRTVLSQLKADLLF